MSPRLPKYLKKSIRRNQELNDSECCQLKFWLWKITNNTIKHRCHWALNILNRDAHMSWIFCNIKCHIKCFTENHRAFTTQCLYLRLHKFPLFLQQCLQYCRPVSILPVKRYGVYITRRVKGYRLVVMQNETFEYSFLRTTPLDSATHLYGEIFFMLTNLRK